MPPHIQPSGLQDIAFNQVTSVIIKSCINMYTKFGCYEMAPCQRAIKEVHEFLMPIMRPFLDIICDTVGHADLCRLSDKRIFYAVIVHSSSKYVNLATLLSRHASVTMLYHKFCIDTVSQLDRLISLTISQKDVSERTLAAIAKTCYKTLQCFIVTPAMTEFTGCFSHLSKCKELKYLKIISLTVMVLHDNTIDRLRYLLQELPKLEYFDSKDMVNILSEVHVDYPFLSLAKLTDNEVDACSLAHVIKICPKLDHIDIGVNASQDGPEVLKILANSELTIKTLKLRGFLWVTELDELVTVKGVCIAHINIDNRVGPLSYKNVYVIGKCCPHLQTLALDILDNSSNNKEAAADIKSMRPTSYMFSKLEALCFGWYQFNSFGQSVLPLILTNANKMDELMLQCSTTLPSQDALDRLLSVNPLTELVELSLVINGPGTISVCSMVTLVERCPKLRGIYVYGRIRQEARVFLQQLYGRIRDENLNLQIDVFER